MKISESFLETTENYIINKYRKDGFLNTKVTMQTKKDTVSTNSEKLLIFIDRGDRVKINSITFDGNDEFSDRKLRKKFKNRLDLIIIMTEIIIINRKIMHKHGFLNKSSPEIKK